MNAVVEMRPAAGGALVAPTWNSARLSAAARRLGPGSDADRHEARRALPARSWYRQADSLQVRAELLRMVFRIAQTREVRDLSTADTVRYQSVCTGMHQTSGVVMGPAWARPAAARQRKGAQGLPVGVRYADARDAATHLPGFDKRSASSTP